MDCAERKAVQSVFYTRSNLNINALLLLELYPV